MEYIAIFTLFLLFFTALAYLGNQGGNPPAAEDMNAPDEDLSDEPTNAQSKPQSINFDEPFEPAKPADVGGFYDDTTDKFLQIYGEVIQAFRTKDVTKLLDYQGDMMGMKEGMKVLDAGCGVGGPATYFAKKYGLEVDGVTISQVQADKAAALIQEKELEGKVRIVQGDYHKLDEIYPKDSFDVVYFLESFGHSYDHAEAITSAWKVLKPGGLLYIKDLFRREPLLPEHEAKIEREVRKINAGYRYNIADLYAVLKHIRQLGFVLSALKTINLKLEDFENLDISNIFQETFGIALIESWEDYVFPVDFFELLCVKPVYELQYGLDKYFLQNMFYMQVHNTKQEELTGND